MLAEHLPRRAVGEWISLGNTPHYISLAFLLATRWLPGHAAVWAVAPLLVAFGVAALVAAGAWRLAGRWAGLVAAALCFAPAQPVLLTVIPHAFRSWTWLADAVLATLLLVWARASPYRRPAHVWLLGAAVSVFAGIDLASDPLFLLSGMAPFVGAAVLVWMRHPGPATRRVALLAAGVAAASVSVALGVGRLMRGRGFVAALSGEVVLAPRDQLGHNMTLLAADVVGLGNGLLPGGEVSIRSAAAALSALATVAAVCAVCVFGIRSLWGRRPTAPAAGAADAVPLWTTYWVLSATFVGAAFVLSTFGAGDPEGSSRYLAPLYYGLAAVLPLWAVPSDRRRAVVAVGVCIVCVAGIWRQGDVLRPESDPYLTALLGSKAMDGRPRIDRLRLPLRAESSRIVAFLRAEGVERGYAGYWDSHSFTWHSGRGIAAYPVLACRAPESDVYCPLGLATASAWYKPRSGRSFVLVGPPGWLAVTPPSAELGPPSSVRRFGPYTVYVYDYDVASRFLPPEVLGPDGG